MGKVARQSPRHVALIADHPVFGNRHNHFDLHNLHGR
jgi:hypothetical protein